MARPAAADRWIWTTTISGPAAATATPTSGPDGARYGFNGVFHTVRENDFAIQTFEFDGYPDVVSIEFLTFEDLGGGRTRLKAHAVYPSMEARDGMAQSGMEGGLTEGYERLDELLAGAKV